MMHIAPPFHAQLKEKRATITITSKLSDTFERDCMKLI